MQLKKASSSKSPFTTGLKTACLTIALTTYLTAGGAWAADQGARHHAQGQYDAVTATYVVVEGDDLVVIGERFEIPVEDLKAQNKLASNEIEVGQKLVVATSAPADAPQITGVLGSPSATTTISGKATSAARSEVRRGDQGKGLGVQSLVAAARRAAQGRAQRAAHHDGRPGFRCTEHLRRRHPHAGHGSHREEPGCATRTSIRRRCAHRRGRR